MYINRFFTLIFVISVIGCAKAELNNSNSEENDTEENQNPSNLTWNKIGQTIEGKHGSYELGYSLALNSDGEKIVIGMPARVNACNNEPECSGSATTYQKQDDNWIQTYQTLYGESPFDEFGYDVDISNDGNTIIIGSASLGVNNNSQVKVYGKNQNSWEQIGEEIIHLNSILTKKVYVSINGFGNICAIGGPNRVGIYRKENQNWVQIGERIEDIHRNVSALSMNSDGNIIAIGYADNRGLVKVFQNIGDNWVQIGQDILGEFDNDHLGSSLKLNNDGDTLIIGAKQMQCSSCESNGFVEVYQKNGNEWIQKGQKLIPLKEGYEVFLGEHIGIDGTGDKIAIGLVKVNNNNVIRVKGYALVFEFNEENEWQQLGNTIAEDFDRLALFSIDLNENGDTVAIGTLGGVGQGEVEVFKLE